MSSIRPSPVPNRWERGVPGDPPAAGPRCRGPKAPGPRRLASFSPAPGRVPLGARLLVPGGACALWLGACQPDFEHGRHDLVDFRIVGIQVDDPTPEPGSTLVAQALVYGGGGFWHDPLPEGTWTLGEEEQDGLRADLSVPAAEGEYELWFTARSADGQEESAVLELTVTSEADTAAPPTLQAVDRFAVEGLSTGAAAEALTRDAREVLEAVSVHDLEEGEVARLEVTVDETSGAEVSDYTARWMAADGAGTFLELEALTTDWFPAALTLEDDEAAWGAALAPGVHATSVLVLDGTGRTSWAFCDLSVDGADVEVPDAEHPVLLDHAGRLFWVDAEGLEPEQAGGAEQRVRASLEEAESPAGIRLVDVEPVETVEGEDPYGTLDLPCEPWAPLGEPFSVDWLALGWCSRSAVAGARVVLEARVLLAPDPEGEP